jgi:hypothetical protein
VANESRPPDKYADRIAESVDLLRGNVRWTLLAFGAIAMTLLAGSQLSNLGHFEWYSIRFLIALTAAAVALAAAAYAVKSVLAVAYAGYTELDNLSQDDIDFINANRPLLEGYSSVDALKQAYNKAISDRYSAFNAMRRDAKVIAGHERWYQYIDRLVDKVLSYVRYNRIRIEADRSRRTLFSASLFAGFSLIIFAWAANPPGESRPKVAQNPPSPAGLELTAQGKTVLALTLGTACVGKAEIAVILLGMADGKLDIITVKSDDCPVARFTVTSEIGHLAAAPGA